MPAADDQWALLARSVDSLAAAISHAKGRQLGKSEIREQAKQVAQFYFRTTRPFLENYGFTAEDLQSCDAEMQKILGLAGYRSLRTSYSRSISAYRRAARRIGTELELRVGRQTNKPAAAIVVSNVEQRILETLKRFQLVAAALAYAQVIRDLHSRDRISYRGAAHELRDILREVLDRLAPDADVLAAPGFKLERDQKRPSQKQKALHILHSRGSHGNALKAATDAVAVIDELTATLARDSYAFGSQAAHTMTTHPEVSRLKMYVDTILAELMAIHG